MTSDEIIKALRICVMDPDDGGDCENCPASRSEGEYCLTVVMSEAASLIEQLTAENAKAVAERDAALADLADARNCKTCKYACDTRECSSCKSKTCKCRECHLDKNAWEWRGLPEAPEEGDKT
nr:MAG TPA: hypothetical protein [Caudoviricetes sp.]